MFTSIQLSSVALLLLVRIQPIQALPVELDARGPFNIGTYFSPMIYRETSISCPLSATSSTSQASTMSEPMTLVSIPNGPIITLAPSGVTTTFGTMSFVVAGTPTSSSSSAASTSTSVTIPIVTPSTASSISFSTSTAPSTHSHLSSSPLFAHYPLHSSSHTISSPQSHSTGAHVEIVELDFLLL